MSYNLTTMQSIYHIEGVSYYISPTSQAGFINFAPNYTARNTTKLEFVFVPGTFNGSAWVGNIGVTPDISDPTAGDDNNDFRLLSYNNGANTRLDVHNQQQDLSTRLDSSTPKLKVEMWDMGINIWNKKGTLIETHTWTSGSTWDSGVSIYGWPVKEEFGSGVIEVLEDFKLYSVKITDDTLGLIYDGVVNANGLYDSVSNSYTTTTGWEIHSEVNKSEIVEISHNNSIVYPEQNAYILTNGKHIETGLFTSGTFDPSLIDIEMNFNTSNWTSSSEKRAVFFGFSNTPGGNWWMSDNFASMLVYLDNTYKVNAYINGAYDAILSPPISLDTEYVFKYTGSNLTFELAGVSATYGIATPLPARELWLGGINLIDDDPSTHPSFNLGRTKIWYDGTLVGDFVPYGTNAMKNNVDDTIHLLVS